MRKAIAEYSDFGFPSLFHYIPDALDRNVVRDAGEIHKDALVSFIVDRPHYSNRGCVIGSGFFGFSLD